MADSNAAEFELRQALKGLKREGRSRMKQQFQRAVKYLKGDQLDDTLSLLYERFPSTQVGDTGQRIAPVTIGLTERYAKEAATLYNQPVHRVITDENGEPDKEATKLVNEEYKRSRWDEIMHANDRYVVTLKTCCVLHEAKRGALRPRITFPHDVYPVCPMNPEFVSADDPDDYEAFVVELFWAHEDMTKVQPRTYLWHSPDKYVFFQGNEPDEVQRVLSTWDNPYRFYQTTEEIDPSTGNRKVMKDQLIPGRMLTFWNTEMPVGELIIDTDVDIVEANRELNIAWSMIFDLIRWQGGAVPVLKTSKADNKSRRKYGVRFPLMLNLEDAFDMVNAAVDYTGQVESLKTFSRLLALAKSMSPNDFATEGIAPASGFAKLVDSLPKIQSREDRIMRNRYLEEEVAWPRNAAIMVQQGIAPEALLRMKMQVFFSDLEFPQTEDEKTKEADRNTKYNQSNPVEMLMQRHGLTEEAAIEKLEKNAQFNAQYLKAPQTQAAPALGVPGVVSSFGGSIRQRRSRQEGADDGNEGSTPRRGRQARGDNEQGTEDRDRRDRG